MRDMGDIKLLKQKLADMENVAVAFSGGVDSAFLLCVAADTPGVNVTAVTAVSPAVPEREVRAAGDICKKRGIRQIVFEGNELEIKEYRENHPERCYFCKRALFENMLCIVKREGTGILVEGSNTDDAGEYRPGMRALAELGIRSPLRETGFSKDDVRKASKEMGLPTWDKPSFSCLATRFPYGEEITGEKLKMAGEAEEYLKGLGYKQFRVRVHGKLARIELLPGDFAGMMEKERRDSVVAAFKSLGFVYVSLDMEGYRSGSMDEVL